MKNIKIKSKLIISFSIVVVFSIFIGILGSIGMLTINSADDKLYNMNLLAIETLGTIRETYSQMGVNIHKFVIYDGFSDPFKAAKTDLETEKVEMVECIAKYEKTIVSDEEQDKLNSFVELLDTFYIMANQMYTLGLLNNTRSSHEILSTRGLQINNEITPILQSLSTLNSELAKEAVDNNGVLSYSMIGATMGLLALSIITSLILTIYISNIISKPIGRMQTLMNQVAYTGDLEIASDLKSALDTDALNKDEIGSSIVSFRELILHITDISKTLETIAAGDLSRHIRELSSRDVLGISLEKMQKSLVKMFEKIGEATNQVSSGANQIADGAQMLAQGSTEQASSIEELSSSIEDVNEKTRENAAMADKAASLSNNIRSNAQKGAAQMDQMMKAVNEINEASQSINKVIKVIDEIAFQTNILALNAAVEAARAGEAGKGFAVVADEVRNLAVKSQEAAKDTGTLIANAIEKSDLGAVIASETAASLTQIVEGINESAQIVNDIARSSDEQSDSIKQINIGVEQVTQVVQQNSATAQESAAASEELNGQADMLTKLVSQFKLS